MSQQASQLIAQQFINGGVIPADLAPQSAVSKKYVDDQLTIRDKKITSAQSAANVAQMTVDSHINSPVAHPAQNITYSGKAVGNNVKQAIDGLDNRIDSIVSKSGNDITEIVDARGGYPVLAARLDDSDRRLFEFGLNVKVNGAKGDGVTDDTVAIQKTIDDVNSAGGGVVYIPTGLYRYSKVFKVYNNITIAGSGAGSILKPVDNYPVSIDPWLAYGCIGNSLSSALKNVTIRDITIDGNNEHNPGNDLINVQALIFLVSINKNVINENITIDNVIIKNAWGNTTQGTFGIMITNASNVRITNCTVFKTGRDGISVSGNSADVIITNNIVHDTQDDGISINPFAPHQTDETFRQVSRVTITNNQLYNVGSRGISLLGAKNALIQSNLIDSTASHGIYVSDDPIGEIDEVIVSQNIVLNASRWTGAILNAIEVGTRNGISIKQSSHSKKDWNRISILQNIVDNPARVGIDVEIDNANFALNSCHISNNEVTNAGAQGMRLVDVNTLNKGCKYVDISDNKIIDSTSRGIDIRLKLQFSEIESNMVLNSGAINDTDGVYIGAALDNCAIKNNLITDTRQVKHQATGISITATCTNSKILNNDVQGNKTLAIYQPEKFQIVESNIGYNPNGFSISTPSLPGGTLPANAVSNSNPFTVQVYLSGGTSIHIIDTKNNDVLIGNTSTITLAPGEKIYFGTNPTSWRWYGG